MPDLITLRRHLCEVEQQFAADIRSPEWANLPDGEKDARGWEVGNARRDVQAGERAEHKAREGR